MEENSTNKTAPVVSEKPLHTGSEDPNVLKIKAIVYGSCSRDPENDDRYGADQRRCEIELRVDIPPDAKTNGQKDVWLQGFIETISRDLKHNRNWRCEFCKERARMTIQNKSIWWRHNYVLIYVHHLCDVDTPACGNAVRAIDAELARMNNRTPSFPARPPIEPGYDFPMSASCAECHDENPKSRKTLKQCSRCGLTRYCSVECQKIDWKRHKVICKTVKEVVWVWT
ncbi:MYND-type domain-containing protein [Mycena chlorophos]|uniref:MYND-type domain-containing protein n=1 Tax=Mycena chlorophos TaxID=658473 RepID=A0A8H6W3H6_MYCCL|nr:MYND-type domain-containing protein [Mycena chlorophos]